MQTSFQWMSDMKHLISPSWWDSTIFFYSAHSVYLIKAMRTWWRCGSSRSGPQGHVPPSRWAAGWWLWVWVGKGVVGQWCCWVSFPVVNHSSGEISQHVKVTGTDSCWLLNVYHKLSRTLWYSALTLAKPQIRLSYRTTKIRCVDMQFLNWAYLNKNVKERVLHTQWFNYSRTPISPQCSASKQLYYESINTFVLIHLKQTDQFISNNVCKPTNQSRGLKKHPNIK